MCFCQLCIESIERHTGGGFSIMSKDDKQDTIPRHGKLDCEMLLVVCTVGVQPDPDEDLVGR